MADLAITASQVKKVSGAEEDGLSGEALTQGQVAYLSSANRWKKAQRDGTLEESGASTRLGIVLNTVAGADQPVKILRGGVIDLGAAAAPTLGAQYTVSATAGGITADAVASGHYPSQIGICTVVATGRLKLAFNAAGVQVP